MTYRVSRLSTGGLSLGDGFRIGHLLNHLSGGQTSSISFEHVRRVCKDNHVLVARDRERCIVGMIVVGFKTTFTGSIGRSAEFRTIAVDPQDEGKGVFSLLWKRAIELVRSKGVDAVEIPVNMQNPARKRAVGVYTAKGLKPRDTWTIYTLDLDASLADEKLIQLPGTNGKGGPPTRRSALLQGEDSGDVCQAHYG